MHQGGKTCYLGVVLGGRFGIVAPGLYDRAGRSDLVRRDHDASPVVTARIRRHQTRVTKAAAEPIP